MKEYQGKVRFNLVLMLSLMISLMASAQEIDNKAEIANAKELIKSGKLDQAYSLLKNLETSNRSDIETIWLLAFVSHAQDKNKESESYYEKAISIEPGNNDLKLEFATMLFQSGKIDKAEKTLQSLLSLKDQKFEILYYLAYIDFWKGNYSSSLKKIEEIHALYKNDTLVNVLAREIERVTSPLLSVGFYQVTDNQPLRSENVSLNLRKSVSALINPEVELRYSIYNPSARNADFRVGNTFSFPSVKLAILAKAGFYYNSEDKLNSTIGEISLSKQIGKNIEFELGFKRQPYNSTQISTTYSLLYSMYFLNFEYNSKNKAILHGNASITSWPDNNYIKSLNIWYLSKPLLKDKRYDLRIGTGFSNADSKKIMYLPVSPNALTDTSVYEQVAGYYSPYYSPGNLTTLMGILNFNYSPVKKLQISLKFNAAIYGRADIPVIIKSYNDSGSPELNLYSYRSNVHPFDASLNLDYFITPASSISIYGSYFDTYYYDSFKTGITLIKRF